MVSACTTYSPNPIQWDTGGFAQAGLTMRSMDTGFVAQANCAIHAPKGGIGRVQRNCKASGPGNAALLPVRMLRAARGLQRQPSGEAASTSRWRSRGAGLHHERARAAHGAPGWEQRAVRADKLSKPAFRLIKQVAFEHSPSIRHEAALRT